MPRHISFYDESLGTQIDGSYDNGRQGDPRRFRHVRCEECALWRISLRIPSIKRNRI